MTTMEHGPADEVLDVMGAPMIVKADAARAPLFAALHPIPPGYSVPPHAHDDEDEFFYLLDGTLTLIGAGGERRVGTGAFVHLPVGEAHGFRNDTDRTVTVLVLVTGGAKAAAMFRAIDRAGRRLGPAFGPAEVAAIAAAHGVMMAPPAEAA